MGRIGFAIRPPTLEEALLGGVWAGLALLLLTPFVVTPETVFPFVVGKALYARTIIEIVFALWALLALLRPAYRPPRSWLLLLLAAALGAALLSAFLGVDTQRSLWSSYERMQGVVDSAHWLAFAVILASVLRTMRHWRILLNLNLAAGLAMALLAIAQGFNLLDAPWLGWRDWHQIRVTATFGNEAFLSTYVILNVLIALGFLVHSFTRSAEPPAAAARRRLAVWSGRLFWAAAAAFGLWAFSLTGVRGGLLGLLAGLGFLLLMGAFFGQARPARLAVTLTSFLAGVGVTLVAILLLRPGVFASDAQFSNPFLDSLVNSIRGRTVNMRRIVWAAGLKGVAERPLAGWGPENYEVVFGRHVTGEMFDLPVHDHAHNKLLELAATQGLPSVLLHLGIWLFAFCALVRIAGALGARERIPILFVGAALMAHFAQSQTSVDSTVGTLQCMLLLALVARLGVETAAAGGGLGRLRGWISNGARRLGLSERPWPKPALAAAALAASTIGVGLNHSIHAGAHAFWKGSTAESAGQAVGWLQRAVEEFEPLANDPRRALFNNASSLWPVLHTEGDGAALRALALQEAETAAALGGASNNWRMQAALANFYFAVSIFDRAYEGQAVGHLEKAVKLAPNAAASALEVAIMPNPPAPPP